MDTRADLDAPAPAARVEERVVTGARIAHPLQKQAREDRSEDKLGTGFGARERSDMRIVAFERATAYPQMVQQLEYDTYDNLVAAGVIRTPRPEHHPRPFPSNTDEEGYVPDPPREP
jgi:hypothetical protein